MLMTWKISSIFSTVSARIASKSDSVWYLMLFLRNIVELVCIPSISENPIA